MAAQLKNIIIAVTGASGAVYARQVVRLLLDSGQVGRLALIFSRNGAEVARYEGELAAAAARVGADKRHKEGAGASVAAVDPRSAHTHAGSWAGIDTSDPRVEVFDNGDMFAAVASGSTGWDAMAIVPCSMGTLGRIASGSSDSLITRAADVMLKERRRLVLVARETPLSLIHLRNMVTVTEAGGIVLPASPSLYSRPGSVEELCATVSQRVVALLGVDVPKYEWKGL